MRPVTIKSRAENKIKRSKKRVFLRSDFTKIAGYDQVGRVLCQLVNEGTLVKIGYGLYAKARKNRITGEVMLDSPGGFDQVSKEALDRLGVVWSSSSAEEAYLSGNSTQIPATSVVEVKDNFSREIAFKDFSLSVVQP